MAASEVGVQDTMIARIAYQKTVLAGLGLEIKLRIHEDCGPQIWRNTCK